MSAAAGDSSSCAVPAKGKPAAGAVTGVTYDAILQANVQTVDLDSPDNPLPEGPLVQLGEFIPQQGAVVYLVRRPG